MMRNNGLTVLVLAAGLAFACSEGTRDTDGGASSVVGSVASSAASTSSSSAGIGGAGGGTGGQGGAADCLMDACEQYADRIACCADSACGWHENTGHGLFGVPPCVSKERVCVVAEVMVRDCSEGTTCLVQGVTQDTENDCTLAPPGSGTLLGRGICVCR